MIQTQKEAPTACSNKKTTENPNICWSQCHMKSSRYVIPASQNHITMTSEASSLVGDFWIILQPPAYVVKFNPETSIPKNTSNRKKALWYRVWLTHTHTHTPTHTHRRTGTHCLFTALPRQAAKHAGQSWQACRWHWPEVSSAANPGGWDEACPIQNRTKMLQNSGWLLEIQKENTKHPPLAWSQRVGPLQRWLSSKSKPDMSDDTFGAYKI